MHRIGWLTLLLDVKAYGFYGTNNTDSTWSYSNISLSAPVLNISAFYIDFSVKYYGNEWSDTSGAHPFANWFNMAYSYDNETYSLTYIQDRHGLCQPNGVSDGVSG